VSITGINPISVITLGISSIQKIRLGRIEEKALLEEVLEELKHNLKTIRDDYLKNNCEINTVVNVLEIKALEMAEKDRKRKKLDFNRIKDGVIDLSCFVNEHQIKYYQRFDTEKLFLKILEKVKEIKNIKELYYKNGEWSNKINPKARMNTIVDLVLLVSNHLGLE
jgi:hypothetical protein